MEQNDQLPGFEEDERQIDAELARRFRPRKRPHLKLVDRDSGELHECANCIEYEAQLAGAEKEIRAWRRRYQRLKQDKWKEAQGSTFWPDALALFDYWRQRCNHPKSRFSAERFFLMEPFLRDDGPELCKRAIDGAVFDPFTKRRRNGTIERFDAIELIFRDRAKFESFVNRAPRKPATPS